VTGTADGAAVRSATVRHRASEGQPDTCHDRRSRRARAAALTCASAVAIALLVAVLPSCTTSPTVTAAPDAEQPRPAPSTTIGREPAGAPGGTIPGTVLDPRGPNTSSSAPCRLTTPLGWLNEGQRTERGVFLSPLGTLRAAMVFVDFPDARAEANVDPRDRQTQTYYDELVPESVAWLDASSFGRVRLDVTASTTWLHLPLPSADYGIERGLDFEHQEAYVQAVVTLAEPTVDFDEVDLLYVVPSRNAAGIAFSPAYVNEHDTVRTSTGSLVSHGVTFGGDIPIWGHKVLVHETLHTFGLADLYHGGGTSPVADASTHEFVGDWDLMGDILGSAPELFSWEKWKLGWIDDEQVACAVAAGTTEATLAPVETGGETLALVVPTGEHTAFVAENRQATAHDVGACKGGVLVYAVDTAVDTLEGPIHVVNAHPFGTRSCSGLEAAPMDLDTPAAPGTSVFTDEASGITISLVASHDDQWQVVVRRDHASG
jgi:M6 family metalloprotease-like protein